MTIVALSRDQFASLWNKLSGERRSHVDIPGRNIIDYASGIVMVCDEDTKFYDARNLGVEVSLATIFSKALEV